MSNLDLTNQFLIAMPTMADPSFNQTVSYICAHNEEGALGIVINRPLELNLSEMLEQMDINNPDETQESRLRCQQVYHGGPVHQDRGFIIHRAPLEWDSSIQVSDNIAVSTSIDILEAISGGDGPNDSFVALGYAGWSAGQLESEILQNAWLNTHASLDLIFDTPVAERWNAAAAALGVDLQAMSSDVGHA